MLSIDHRFTQKSARRERNFRTWQGRLPQELRIRNLDTLAAAMSFCTPLYRLLQCTVYPPGTGARDRIHYLPAHRS